MPDHGSLLHRTAAASITVALVLLLVGLRLVSHERQGLDQRADLGQLLPAHVGWGVFPRGVVGTLADVVRPGG